MSANVPTSLIIEPPQFFLEHGTPGIRARSLADGRPKSQSENPAAGLLEGINRRTVCADLPCFSDQFTVSFFVRKLNNDKANKPIVAGAPTRNVNEIVIVKPPQIPCPVVNTISE